MALNSYLRHVQSWATGEQGEPLAALFVMERSARMLHAELNVLTDLSDWMRGRLAEPFDALVALHLSAGLAFLRGDAEAAYGFQSSLMNHFLKVFQSESGTSLVPLMGQLSRDLRVLAEKADLQQTQKGLKGEKLEDAGRILNRAFSIMLGDRGAEQQESKKLGALTVTNIMFKIYFSMNNLRLCKNPIRAVEETSGFPPLSMFPQSQRVTYKFFAGMLAMYEDQLGRADEGLSYAFDHCHAASRRNKRLILQHLVPVRLLYGSAASPELLRKYELRQFVRVTRAVKTGNVRLFRESLIEHELYFIRKGCYLILQKLIAVVYRNLFRRIHIILGGKSRLPLSSFLKVLRSLGETSIDYDELECILSNLIGQGLIRGYVSHELRFLVVSNVKAFPPLTRQVPSS